MQQRLAIGLAADTRPSPEVNERLVLGVMGQAALYR